MKFPDYWGVNRIRGFMNEEPTPVKKNDYYEDVAQTIYEKSYNSLNKKEKSFVRQEAYNNAKLNNLVIVD